MAKDSFVRINARWATFRIWIEAEFQYADYVIQLLVDETDDEIRAYARPPFVYVSDIRRT